MSFQKLRSDANGITYAETSDPDYTVRFKFSHANKSLSGTPVQNNVCEIIINDLSDVTVGGTTVQEALSVRVKVSGSYASKARKNALVAAAVAQLNTWATENVFEGFEPTTLPVGPA